MPEYKSKSSHHVEYFLKAGTFLYWQSQYFVIENYNAKQLTISVANLDNGEHAVLEYTQLICTSADDEPIFAVSMDELRLKINTYKQQGKDAQMLSEGGISPSLIKKAQDVIDTVEYVQRAIKDAQERSGTKKIGKTKIIKDCLKNYRTNHSLTTYYDHLRRYTLNNGIRSQIALSFRTSRFGKIRKSAALLHVVDELLDRYIFHPKGLKLRPQSVYNKLQKVLKRTCRLWVDPNKCGSIIPSDLIEELLDEKIPFETISSNKEKMILLSPVEESSQSWFYAHYAYLREVNNLTDDQSHSAHLNYGHRTQVPLDLGFIDEYQLSIYKVRNSERVKLIDLWVTIMIDAYSRCSPGFTVHARVPDLEIGLLTLRNCIFPNDFTGLMEYPIWKPYGIFKATSFDNAMMHDSNSYIEIAKGLSGNGEYRKMDIVYRPPRQPRKGTLIERLIGTFKSRFKEVMSDIAIDVKDMLSTNTDKQAIQIENYISKCILDLINEYHHTRHSTLRQRPIDCWNEAIEQLMGLPKVPALTPEIERLFWPLYHDTRQVKDNQIALFGMHYSSASGKAIPSHDFAGRIKKYHIHYSPQNLGKIAVYHNGVWIDDMVALELLGPEGKTLKSVSKVQRKIAQILARQAGESPKEWRYFLEDDKDKKLTSNEHFDTNVDKKMVVTPREDSDTTQYWERAANILSSNRYSNK